MEDGNTTVIDPSSLALNERCKHCDQMSRQSPGITSPKSRAEAITVPVINSPLLLKPPRQPFENNAQTAKLVFFLHPGYADTHNILLTLPAFDSGGIHHETARIACAILANCRWDGFLASSRHGTPLHAGPDDVLPHGQYYFCIEDDEQYPVIPSFDHFSCPASIPPSYSSAPVLSSSVDEAVRRDVTCRITASILPNETAHIIPAAQSTWWQRNSMFMYTVNPDQGLDTRCADNTILLRRDLHKMWDDNKFAIVPKQGKWVVHGLWNSSAVEIQERYHNLELQPLAGVSRHFFLCRFALAILSKSPFLSQRVPRRLVLVSNDASAEPLVQTVTVDDYQQKFSMFARTSSRSRSPKKRAKSAPEDSLNDGDAAEWSEDDSIDSEESEEEEFRGRPKKRKLEVLSSKRHEAATCAVAEEAGRHKPCRKRPRTSTGFHLQTPPRSTSPANL